LRLYSFLEGLVRVTGLRVQNSLCRGIKGNSSFRWIWGWLRRKEAKMSLSLVSMRSSLVSMGSSLVSMGGPIKTHISSIYPIAATQSFTIKLTLIYILYNIILDLSIVLLYLYLLYIY
jgi:hypothetical protein